MVVKRLSSSKKVFFHIKVLSIQVLGKSWYERFVFSIIVVTYLTKGLIHT